jgi:hypothetical protein
VGTYSKRHITAPEVPLDGVPSRLAPAGGPSMIWWPPPGARCDNHPEMAATDLLVHILAPPNLEGARCVAERSTFANVRRT